MIRLERNDARMIRWTYKIGLRKRFTEKSRTRFKLKSLKESLWNRRMQWFGNLEITKTVFGLVNLEPLRLAVVSQEDELGKSQMRKSKVI